MATMTQHDPPGASAALPGDQLPQYTTVAAPRLVPADGQGLDEMDMTAAFANLRLDGRPKDPDPDMCLAHLKLLHAIQAMKEDVGFTDGLWNIWDSRADSLAEDLSLESAPFPSQTAPTDDNERRKLALSRIREKRWALFVARAVDRYEAWWRTLYHGDMLTSDHMHLLGSPNYTAFPTNGTPLAWADHMLPPLDVLMVFHSHMLNPRAFLEDAMRNGMGSIWTTGMPWEHVNRAIRLNDDYAVPDATKQHWTRLTNRAWANQDDSMTKALRCAFCSQTNAVPWTTCGMDEGSKAGSHPGLVGNGYGDGQFSQLCRHCGRENYKELLSVSKFVHDASLLLSRNVAMPGTILDPHSGCPERPQDQVRHMYPRTFPNRMIQLDLRIKIVELLQPNDKGHPRPTMETIRGMVEEVVSNDSRMRRIDSVQSLRVRYAPRAKARVSVRRMMSRYWENFSPFALDLAGAVVRQGVFVDKMVKLDWLHSPSATKTMERLIQKYHRFMAIMRRYPSQVAVPTLDVDLAWHTHQLSPFAYYASTVARTGKFIDHDDKIDQDKLSAAFEWTTKTYQDMFKEIYSECTCWYCETIRSAQVPAVGKIFSGSHKIAESFHTSGAAKLCPPDNSAHISAHNAVRSLETEARERVTKHIRARHQVKLDRDYEKARRRAQKKGRQLPARDEYYDHWGYQYYSEPAPPSPRSPICMLR
ncbi:hypothetical protein RJ55_01754 [Drechmeria coniospora]|nr:hypothetical protein RJ55_01754 [Drechmeria coniospora]